MNLRFWRNVALIGAAHVGAIAALVRWSQQARVPSQHVVWLNGAPDAAAIAGAAPSSKPITMAPPPSDEREEESVPDEQPMLASAKSDIQLPVPAPPSTPTPKPIATPSASPTPAPKVKVPPKPRPRVTPSTTPRPKPRPSPRKMILAKASPRPTVKPENAAVEADESPSPSPTVAPAEASASPHSRSASNVAAGKGSATTGAGHGGGATIQSQFGWYGSMLHDRFYSEWAQPSSLGVNSKASALVKLRIERDGRISDFQIVRSSGNATVDESINAVAKRVTKVDPLPAGLGNGDHYDVKINFELNSE